MGGSVCTIKANIPVFMPTKASQSTFLLTRAMFIVKTKLLTKTTKEKCTEMPATTANSTIMVFME